MSKYFPTRNSISKLLDDLYKLSSALCRIDVEFVEIFVGSSNVRRLRQIADLVLKFSYDVRSQVNHFND